MTAPAGAASLLVLVLLSTSAPPVFPQGNLLWVNPGQSGVVTGSAIVAAAGDVDGDSVPDLVAQWGHASTPTDIVKVLSGADGSEIWTLNLAPPINGWNIAIAGAGDVDADGFADVIVGAIEPVPVQNQCLAIVFSGLTGLPMFTVNGGLGHDLGFSVGPAGDVNGDGFGDVLVGAPRWGGGPNGYVRIYAGPNGAVLRTIFGPPSCPGGLFGYSVAAVGDLTGDGVPDLIAGDPASCNMLGSGTATVHSGATGGLLFTLTGLNNGDDLGGAVAGIGDVDGDNVPDVVASSGGGPAYSLVASGATGSILHTLSAGNAVAGLGDVDGDAVPDIVAGSSATVFSLGASGVNLGNYGLPNAHGTLAGIGDVNGDGIPDLALGEKNGTRVWAIRMGVGYQQNSALADLQVDGLQGTANVPAGLTLAANTPALLTLASTSTGMPWELGLGFAPLVPQTAGAFTTVGGQILNLDPANPGLTVLWSYFQSPGFANVAIPFSVPAAARLSAQMLVVAPAMPSGVAISQPTRLVVL